MNLRRLEHLTALAEEGSFAGAAQKIHLSQPALTRSIQVLEEELGLRLFERMPRGVELTAAGKMVLRRARRVLFESHALDRDVALLKTHDLGEVRFGFGPYPAALLLAGVLSALTRTAPGLTVRGEVGNASDLLEQLHAEQIDFFVAERRAITPSADVAMHKLKPHRCAWIARPGHPVFNEANITAAHIREARLASVPLGGYGRERLRRALGYGPQETVHFQVECNDFPALKQLAAQSDTVIFAPLAAVSREMHDGSLAEIPLQRAPGFNMEMAIIRLAGRTVAPAAEKAMAAILDCDEACHISGWTGS